MRADRTISLDVLGPLGVRVGTERVAIAGRLKHRLLARLALVPGVVVSIDSLVDALWGERAPRTARQSLHVHVSTVRSVMRSSGAHDLIRTTADGAYVLGDVDVDAVVFEQLAAAGIQAQRDRNLRSAADALADALALWGEPYECLDDHYGAIAVRQRLEAVHERVRDTYAQVLLDLQRHDEALPLLRETIAGEPLRELPYAQLIGHYRRVGEPGRAAAVEAEARRVFEDALGVTPTLSVVDPEPTSAAAHQVAAAPRSIDPVSTGLMPGINGHHLVALSARVDRAPVLDHLEHQAGVARRRVAYGRVSGRTDSPLSPMLELADMVDESGAFRSRRLRTALFDRIVHRLIVRHGVAPVVVIDGLDRADAVVHDLLMRALDVDGPIPFTVVGIIEPSGAHQLPGRLQELLGTAVAIPGDPVPPPNLEAARADDDERTVLALLWCARLPAETELIARASDRSPAVTAAAIDRLVARRIVSRDGAGRLGLFDADEVEQAAAADLSQRRAAHSALAAALEPVDGVGSPHRTVARAYHLLRSHGVDRWRLIADAVLEAVSYLEAMGAYLDIADLLAGADPDQSAWPENEASLELRVALGRALIRSAQVADAVPVLESAIGMARRFGCADLLANAVRSLLEQRSPQRITATERDLIDEALAGLPSTAGDTRVQLMTDLANSWYFEDPALAARLADQALGIARGADPGTLARALTGHIQAHLRPGNEPARLDWALEAQRLARQADLAETQILALTYEADALFGSGQVRRAEAPLQYAAALAAELQVPRYRWWAAAWQALLDFVLGEVDDAEHAFLAALDLSASSSQGEAFECFAGQLSMLRFVQGRGSELLPILEQGLDDDTGLEYLAPTALAYAQAGDLDAARRVLARVCGPGGLAERSDIVVPFALGISAEACHLTGDRDLAALLLGRIEPIAHVHATLNIWGGGGFHWGPLHHGRGLMLDVLGQHSDAISAFAEAVAAADASGAVVFAGRSRAQLARLRTH